LFDVLSGLPNTEKDKEVYWSEAQDQATKMIYKVLKQIFSWSKDANIRLKASESGLVTKILDRLIVMTGEKPWKLAEKEKEEVKEQNPIMPALPDLPSIPSDVKTKKGRSGVGYTTGTGTVWNVTKYF